MYKLPSIYNSFLVQDKPFIHYKLPDGFDPNFGYNLENDPFPPKMLIDFDLSSEGYKRSWQNAFLKADVKGIKELLNLPNFNYEIFEYITSITKKQISEKLGE